MRCVSLRSLWICSFLLAAVAGSSPAQFFLSEISINPPGVDQGQEFVEIAGSPMASLAGWSLVVIDGDGPFAGIVDTSMSLSMVSTGSNGLALIRDNAVALSPAPNPSTGLFLVDFVPDIENGTSTYLLGFGVAPSTSADLDANDDGVLDTGALTGFHVIDAVSITNNGAGDHQYAEALGGVDIDGLTFTPDAIHRSLSCGGNPGIWIGGDLTTPVGSLIGPYSYDPLEVFGFESSGLPGSMGQTLTPGNPNLYAAQALVEILGVSCPDPSVEFTATSPILGQILTVSIVGAEALAPGFLAYSGPAGPQPPSGSCLIHVDLSSAQIFTMFTTDAAGTFSLPVPLPLVASFECLDLRLQVAILGLATPLVLTNGVRLVLGN